MENRTSFKEQLKGTVNELNGLFEEVESRLKEGTKEAREIFERERSKFREFMAEQQLQFHRFGLQDDAGFRKLMDKLDNLKHLLNEADPVEPANFSSWKDQRLRFLYELEFLVREFYPEMNEEEKAHFNNLKTVQDKYRIRLTECFFDALGSLTEEKNALNEALTHTIQYVENEIVVNWKRFDGFRDEISVSFDHMKKAFGNLFQK